MLEKIPTVGEVWIFSGTADMCNVNVDYLTLAIREEMMH